MRFATRDSPYLQGAEQVGNCMVPPPWRAPWRPASRRLPRRSRQQRGLHRAKTFGVRKTHRFGQESTDRRTASVAYRESVAAPAGLQFERPEALEDR